MRHGLLKRSRLIWKAVSRGIEEIEMAFEAFESWRMTAKRRLGRLPMDALSTKAYTPSHSFLSPQQLQTVLAAVLRPGTIAADGLLQATLDASLFAFPAGISSSFLHGVFVYDVQ